MKSKNTKTQSNKKVVDLLREFESKLEGHEEFQEISSTQNLNKKNKNNPILISNQSNFNKKNNSNKNILKRNLNQTLEPRGWYNNDFVKNIEKFNSKVKEYREKIDSNKKNSIKDYNQSDLLKSNSSNVNEDSLIYNTRLSLTEPDKQLSTNNEENQDHYLSEEMKIFHPNITTFERSLIDLKNNFKRSRVHVFESYVYDRKPSEIIPEINSSNVIHSPFKFSIRSEMRQSVKLPTYEFTFVPYNTSDSDLEVILNSFRKFNVIGMQIVTRKEHPGFIILFEPISKLSFVFEIALIRNRFVVPYSFSTRRMYIFESSRRETLFLNKLLKEFIEEPGKIFIGWNLNREVTNLNKYRGLKPYAIWSPHFLEKDFQEQEREYRHVSQDWNIVQTLFYAYRKYGMIPTFWRGIEDIWLSFCAVENLRRRWNIFHEHLDGLYEFLLLTAIRGDSNNLNSIPEASKLREKLSEISIDALSYPHGSMQLHQNDLKENLKSWPDPIALSISERRSRLLSRPTTISYLSNFELLQEKNRNFKKTLTSRFMFQDFIHLHYSWLNHMYNPSSPSEPVLGMKRSREASGIIIGLNEKKSKWIRLFDEPELILASTPKDVKSIKKSKQENKNEYTNKKSNNQKKKSKKN